VTAIVHRQHTLRCDHPDHQRLHTASFYGPFDLTRARLRKRAAADGWTYVLGQDYCREHKPEEGTAS
jgi:hypothetical protein